MQAHRGGNYDKNYDARMLWPYGSGNLRTCGKDPEAEITVGVDIADKGNTSYPVYTDLSACQEDVDVVIDFSSAKAVDALLDYCGERKLPLVLCTTGLSEEQLAR